MWCPSNWFFKTDSGSWFYWESIRHVGQVIFFFQESIRKLFFFGRYKIFFRGRFVFSEKYKKILFRIKAGLSGKYKKIFLQKQVGFFGKVQEKFSRVSRVRMHQIAPLSTTLCGKRILVEVIEGVGCIISLNDIDYDALFEIFLPIKRKFQKV